DTTLNVEKSAQTDESDSVEDDSQDSGSSTEFSTFKLIEPEPTPVTGEQELEERVAQHTGETDYLEPNFVPEHDASAIGGPRYTPYASDACDAILGMTEDQYLNESGNDTDTNANSIEEPPFAPTGGEEYPVITPVSELVSPAVVPVQSTVPTPDIAVQSIPEPQTSAEPIE